MLIAIENMSIHQPHFEPHFLFALGHWYINFQTPHRVHLRSRPKVGSCLDILDVGPRGTFLENTNALPMFVQFSVSKDSPYT